NAPDRFARREDRSGERRIFVLQERKHLEEKEIERLAKLGERSLEPSLVIRPEFTEQIVDLILQRELGQHADGLGVLKPRLQRCEIERRRGFRFIRDKSGRLPFRSRRSRGRNLGRSLDTRRFGFGDARGGRWRNGRL